MLPLVRGRPLDPVFGGRFEKAAFGRVDKKTYLCSGPVRVPLRRSSVHSSYQLMYYEALGGRRRFLYGSPGIVMADPEKLHFQGI